MSPSRAFLINFQSKSLHWISQKKEGNAGQHYTRQRGKIIYESIKSIKYIKLIKSIESLKSNHLNQSNQLNLSIFYFILRILKFRYSETASKKSTIYFFSLHYILTSKQSGRFFQIFVAFTEHLYFTVRLRNRQTPLENLTKIINPHSVLIRVRMLLHKVLVTLNIISS
jgi:hypothetical protein